MTDTAALPVSRLDRDRVLAWLQDYGVYAAIAALVVVNIAITPRFLSVENLRTQLVQVAPVVIVSLGMALVIGTEGVDLSVGSVMALATALIPLYLGYGVVPAVVAGLLGGVAVGLVNGSLVAFVGVQPIVATLALFVGGRGIALVVAGGRLKDIQNPGLLNLGSSSVAGIPLPVVAAAVLTVVVMAVVRRTTFGRRLVAIGGNRTASELSGLPVRRILLLVYVASGLLAAAAGILATARLQASDPSSLGLLMELSAITAVVVGGTPLTGGRVRVLGTVAGALLIQLVRATLIKHDLADSLAQMVQAVIILAAVYAARGRTAR
ncbi:ABC transporter permease [Actinoallomurus bryophytorum]|uniref:Monosaccharide ABC transporter membrane protein (CUT2 family) n=1 Tax=Actinoallomurus bryophytorum TaxID=1490222 RepID=A0A543CSX2_9ACTN|nr:ABC transporter permease [Actinoallomurus bryophytorum]TQM00204.1 monosaccharide ABC transporter membrane protein (CUT2 family) [Actinoallomurus bryophytorum]